MIQVIFFEDNIMNQLILEAVVVGATLALVLGLVAAASPRWLAAPARAAVTGLIVGAGFHLAFEILGLNKKYCVVGHACSSQNLTGT